MNGDMAFEVFKLSSSGLCCTQIMFKMALEEDDEENTDLLRAFRGMCGGINHRGKTCGVLTAGIGIIGLYSANGNVGEACRDDFREMMDEYMDWFENEFKSMDCRDLVGIQNISDFGEKISYPVKCGEIIQKSYTKLQDILDQHGYELGGRN
ncbi:Putative redox-active protein [Clostridiaceae bacterium BL-3]|nr:Putative redox-active protein [Clostridiaceae bacterium BL-3]